MNDDDDCVNILNSTQCIHKWLLGASEWSGRRKAERKCYQICLSLPFTERSAAASSQHQQRKNSFRDDDDDGKRL